MSSYISLKTVSLICYYNMIYAVCIRASFSTVKIKTLILITKIMNELKRRHALNFGHFAQSPVVLSLYDSNKSITNTVFAIRQTTLTGIIIMYQNLFYFDMSGSHYMVTALEPAYHRSRRYSFAIKPAATVTKVYCIRARSRRLRPSLQWIRTS